MPIPASSVPVEGSGIKASAISLKATASEAMGRKFKQLGECCKKLNWGKVSAVALIIFAVLMVVAFGSMVGLGPGIAGVAMLSLGAGAAYFGVRMLMKKQRRQEQEGVADPSTPVRSRSLPRGSASLSTPEPGSRDWEGVPPAGDMLEGSQAAVPAASIASLSEESPAS